jgi:hypothetical protein
MRAYIGADHGPVVARSSIARHQLISGVVARDGHVLERLPQCTRHVGIEILSARRLGGHEVRGSQRGRLIVALGKIDDAAFVRCGRFSSASYMTLERLV